MLQSFSVQPHHQSNHPHLSCQKCHQKPSEFILLLCEHIICGTCLNLSNSVQGKYGFDGVRCPCGAITYFHKIESSVLEGEKCDCEENECDGENCKERSFDNHGFSVNIHQGNRRGEINRDKNTSARQSVGLIQSNNTIKTKNMSYLQTEAYSKCNDSISNKDSRLRDEAMLQKSKYPVEENSQMMNQTKSFKKVEKRASNKASIVVNKSKSEYDPSFINSESLVMESFEDQENENPNERNSSKKQGKFSIKKEAIQRFEEFCYEEELPQRKTTKVSKQNHLSEELKSEISFLQIQHKKLLENLNRAYFRAVSKINEDYETLENNLKDLCLETIVFNNKNSHVDIGKMIKTRYEGEISNNVERMTQEIKKFTLNNQNEIELNEGKINNSSKEAIIKETSKNERKTSIARFSSPQPNCKNHTQPESVCIFSPRIRGNEELCYRINSYAKGGVESNSFVNSLNQSAQSGPRLQKKSVKHRTNVIIEL